MNKLFCGSSSLFLSVLSFPSSFLSLWSKSTIRRRKRQRKKHSFWNSFLSFFLFVLCLLLLFSFLLQDYQSSALFHSLSIYTAYNLKLLALDSSFFSFVCALISFLVPFPQLPECSSRADVETKHYRLYYSTSLSVAFLAAVFYHQYIKRLFLYYCAFRVTIGETRRDDMKKHFFNEKAAEVGKREVHYKSATTFFTLRFLVGLMLIA